jgi:Cupin domain
MQSVFHSNLDKEFGSITEFWSPRVVAVANGQYVKLAKAKGEFVWHAHADEDEFFLVRKGTFTIRYRDRSDVVLREGDFQWFPGVSSTAPWHPRKPGSCSSSPPPPSTPAIRPPI